MEIKNVDLVALNKAAMLIQEHASLGYNLIKVAWTRAENERSMVRLACLKQATAIPPPTKVGRFSPNCH